MVNCSWVVFTHQHHLQCQHYFSYRTIVLIMVSLLNISINSPCTLIVATNQYIIVKENIYISFNRNIKYASLLALNRFMRMICNQPFPYILTACFSILATEVWLIKLNKQTSQLDISITFHYNNNMQL